MKTNLLSLAAIIMLPLIASCTTPADGTSGISEPAADIVTITGAALYRERIALPPGAVTLVAAEDVSLADAPSKILAEQTITMDGKSVPVPFSLDVPRSALTAAHRTNLRVRIEDGSGKLLFITDTHNSITATTGSNRIDMGNVVLVKVAH